MPPAVSATVDRTGPRLRGPGDHMGPAQIEGRNSMAKPGAMTVRVATSRTTSCRSWGR